jgi:Peptidase A4 family
LVRTRLTVALVAAGALWGAPAALGATGSSSTSSSNWAGYAIHQSKTEFTKVVGAWTQPKLACTAGHSSYSAYWIGLGGYNENSDALEQIGTEADCSASGAAKMSAWYELVPAPSRNLKLTVHAGDTLLASVTVTGHRVRLALEDATTHKTVAKTVHDADLDLTSAEWIAEAPSECANDNSCQTLPLADFGSTNFSFAYAQTSTGRKGSISNRAWDTTKITLVAGGARFVGFGGGGDGIATPSKLTGSGSAFSVTYSESGGPGGPYVATDVRSAELAR